MHVYTRAMAHTYTLQLQRETWAKPSFWNAKLHTRPLDVNEGAKISPFYKTVQGASGDAQTTLLSLVTRVLGNAPPMQPRGFVCLFFRPERWNDLKILTGLKEADGQELPDTSPAWASPVSRALGMRSDIWNFFVLLNK